MSRMAVGSHPRTNALKPWISERPGKVSDGAVEDDAVAGLGEDRVAQVVADERAIVNLAEAIGDVDVAGLQGVDGPGVHGPDPALFMAAVEHTRGEFRPRGHVLRREGATDHGHVVVDRLPVALKLGMVAVRAQHTPGLFDRYLAHPSQNLIGDLGPAVGKTIAFPFGREEEHLLAGDGLGKGEVGGTHDNASREPRDHRGASPLARGVEPCGFRSLDHVERLLRRVVAGRSSSGMISIDDLAHRRIDGQA